MGSNIFIAKSIQLTNGETLSNKTFCIFNGFIIVDGKTESEGATWYSVSMVESMRDVNIFKGTQKVWML